MTATKATIGYGSLFQTNQGGSPNDWTALAEVVSVNFPPLTVDVIDAGHEAMPGEYREVLTGIRTAGDVTVVCNFQPVTLQSLFNELNSMLLRQRRLVFPNGTSIVFNAYLISLESGLAAGDVVQATAHFRVTGAPGPLTVV